MAILKHIAALVLAICLTGCFEEFDLNTDSAPVLCLNSLITDGEPIKVEVTHTWDYNDQFSATDHKVTDAVITILANGESVGEGYRPEQGDRITIIAESPTYGRATAEVTVPYATPVGTVAVSPVMTDIWTGDEDFFHYEMLAEITFNLRIEMNVEDPAGSDNYYQFGYESFGNDYSDYPDGIYDSSAPPGFYAGTFDYNSEPIFKEHIGIFESVMGNGEDTDFVFFTDRQFRGKNYPLHLLFTNGRYYVKSVEYDESKLDCGIDLRLTTVSQSYYNWAVYQWNTDEGILGDLADIGLAEPLWGYSNVSTGAGVVAARATTTYRINLKDFFADCLKNSGKVE